jgi:glycosyltransferase involved in cell wall biosynthesis
MSKNLTGTRILLLFPHMVMPGGALNYTLKLAEELQVSGATVGIITLKTDQNKFPPPPGVAIISLNGPLSSSLWYWLLLPFWQHKINKAILAWCPDVLVPQVFPANWWGWLYKKRYPATKLVWICQEPSAFIHSKPWIHALKPWWKSMLARLLQPVLSRLDISLAQQCDAAVANSYFTAGIMEQTYGFPATGIATPGLDITTFEDHDGPRNHDIITVARLTRFKRIDFLLEVFRELLQQYPQLRYHIVGTGEEEDSLKVKASQLGIESKVHFHGVVDNKTLVSLYHRSCLFLHGAQHEPFGMAPLEAIASGTPVVGHQSGGLQGFVTDRCGRLIDSMDPVEWAMHCSTYLGEIAKSDRYDKTVRQCARHYGWSTTLKPALEIIGDVAGR